MKHSLLNSVLALSLLANPTPIRANNLQLEPINVAEHFYSNDPNYKPIRLEASLIQPILVDLQEVIAKAVENNINLSIARQDSIIAKWKFWGQFSELLPDITSRIGYKSLDGDFFLNSNFQAPIDENQATANLRVNYRAFSGGTKTFLALAENNYRKSTKANEQDQYNQTLKNSVGKYYDLLIAQLALSSKKKFLDSVNSSLEQANKFEKAGLGTKYDVLQAKAQSAKAQSDLIEQEAMFRRTEIEMAEFLNTPLYIPYSVKDKGIQELQLFAEELDVDTFIKTAFENNPRIQAALKAKKAAVYQGLSVIGEYLPTLDLYVDFNGVGDKFDNLADVTTMGLEARYDIGEGLGLDAISQGLESKAAVKRARLLYKQELLAIEKQLRYAFIDFEKSKAKLAAAKQEILASREALRLANLRYKNGLEILTNILAKESELNDVELRYLQSAKDFNLAQLDLAYEMGDISIDSILN